MDLRRGVSGLCRAGTPTLLPHYFVSLSEVRDELEAELSWRDRNLFSLELDLIFIDTTSLYVYTDMETDRRKRGYSRDRRPDLPQYVLCVVVNRDGWPVAWEIFPGNTADCRALLGDDGESAAQASAHPRCGPRGRSRDDLGLIQSSCSGPTRRRLSTTCSVAACANRRR